MFGAEHFLYATIWGVETHDKVQSKEEVKNDMLLDHSSLYYCNLGQMAVLLALSVYTLQEIFPLFLSPINTWKANC